MNCLDCAIKVGRLDFILGSLSETTESHEDRQFCPLPVSCYVMMCTTSGLCQQEHQHQKPTRWDSHILECKPPKLSAPAGLVTLSEVLHYRNKKLMLKAPGEASLYSGTSLEAETLQAGLHRFIQGISSKKTSVLLYKKKSFVKRALWSTAK